jgi:Fic family protein
MFTPKYTITSELLANIKNITTLVAQLNAKKYPHIVLHNFEIEARSLSAHASTSIEGNPLPLTDVKKLLKSRPDHIRDTQREVLNYNNALVFLNNEIQKTKEPDISNTVIHRIHQLVMDGLTPKGQLSGYRKDPVFVNDPKLGKTIYWPPDQQDVQELMGELVDFVNHKRNSIDPLILSGVFHKQFVIIHPYIDGNGRTVRLITKALLASMGLDTFNLFSFENYYNSNVTKYFEFVGERGNYYDLVDNIDFTPWLVYFTGGIIDELLRVSKELDRESLTPQTALLDQHKIILNYIDTNGFITDKIYSSLVKRAKATRNLDFRKLITLGLIKMEGKGKGTYYKRI